MTGTSDNPPAGGVFVERKVNKTRAPRTRTAVVQTAAVRQALRPVAPASAGYKESRTEGEGKGGAAACLALELARRGGYDKPPKWSRGKQGNPAPLSFCEVV